MMKKTSYNKGEIYAIETGDYVGQMFVVVESRDDYIGCLRLPDMENIHVPKEAFDRGRNNGIMTLMEKLPKKVFKISKAQYIKNNE